jgi:hypothetical protein
LRSDRLLPRCIDRLSASLSPVDLVGFRIQIVGRGRKQAFITRTQSPRFDWSVRPTHLQTGRNLDFLTAGHIWRPLFPERAVIHVVEKNTLKDISAELVLADSLKDDDFY